MTLLQVPQRGGSQLPGTDTSVDPLATTASALLSEQERSRRYGKGCWYLTTVYECVLCGRTKIYRERQWDHPKPAEHEKRWHHYEEACMEHFL